MAAEVHHGAVAFDAVDQHNSLRTDQNHLQVDDVLSGLFGGVVGYCPPQPLLVPFR
jgi:hypothetical protein